MEAVKRLPMISFELKNSPEATSFHNLKQCIAEYYHEDPDSYAKEFRELEQLRGLAVRPRVDFECCSTVKRYYSQLHSLQNRFPLSSENELLDFAWKDIYSGSMWRSSNVKYEMASILYNIAALHSKLGIEEDRNDAESMKIACTHFQCAAWAFGEIKNQYSLVLKGDLTGELMVFMQQICFAQAQECILEKSLADNRKAAIIAKVTAQVISFYNAALTALFSQCEEGMISDLIGQKNYKEWQKYIKFKTSYLSSVLFLHQGMNSEEQRKMGERVALYNAACEKLEDAKKESKGMNKIDVINEALTFATDIIEGKRKNAKQENEFIYHESVPEVSSISAVQGANLVQGIPFDVTDPQVIGDDVFKRLVPMKTHEHLSVYSEEKANILRSLGARIDDRDAELASFMGSLNSDLLNSMGQPQEKLPQGLVDRCAELSAKPNAIPDLVESMSNLADICCDVEATLKDIKMILEDEAKQEQSYQKQIGKRPTGHMAELNREYTKYFEAHNKAGESNDTLRKAMELHVSNLKILAQPLSVLKSQVPQADPVDEITRKELQTLLNKVEEMKQQRDGIFLELREKILNQDDITAQLVAHGDKDIKDLFKKELSKYATSVNIIEQNLVAQGNILKALTDTYAKHAMTLKSYNDTKLKREQFYASLVASFDVYEELLSKSAKGLDFYKKLYGNIQKLMSRVKAARDVQEEERQQILKKSLPKAQPVDSTKHIDTSYKTMINSVPSSGGGPKLKDYLKSGMVPGMGGLRDDFSKLPAIRPSPVGQENIPTSNPASCPSMNYPTNSYKGQQQYYQPAIDNSYLNHQQITHYPASDQHSNHSGSGSMSSSTTSLNNEYYNQAMNASNNQGYVNPIFQTAGHQTYQNPSAYSRNDGSAGTQAAYQNSQQTSPYPSQFGNYAGTYGQQQPQPSPSPVQQQHEFPKNQTQQPSFDNSVHQQPPSFNSLYSNDQYYNLNSQQSQVIESSHVPNQNQYQSPQFYGVSRNSVSQQQQNTTPNNVSHQQAQNSTSENLSQQQYSYQQQQYPVQQQQTYPVAASPSASQYQQYQNTSVVSQQVAPVQNVSNFPTSPSPAPQTSDQQQYSMQYQQIPQQIQQNQTPDYSNNQNCYGYIQGHNYQTNPYVDQFNQESYTGYAQPYVTQRDASSAYVQQPVAYNQTPDITNNLSAQLLNQDVDAAQNCTHPTQPQPNAEIQQPTESPIVTKPIKSTNIDLLSGIDFTMSDSTIDNVPTLMPVSAIKSVEPSPKKILEPLSPVVETKPVKLNDDLADLDFTSLSVASPVKTLEPEKRQNHGDPFDDSNALKQFHKQVEGLEKFMETVTVKTLNGVTPLANKWKELQDLLVKDEGKRSVSIARLFPDKNRSVDCLPYDHARVLLATSTDNYINAVLVRDCGPASFILTQTPMANTVNDYWEMVWSQKTNTLVCLHTANELLDPFWPQNINEEKYFGEISVVLEKQFELSHCHENMLKITRQGSDNEMKVSLLQVKAWKKSSADHILDVAGNIITTFKQHNPDEKQQQYPPIVLNCISGGAERSGLMSLGICSIFATQMRKPTLLNVIDHWFRICSHRKSALEDEHLIQLSFEIILSNAHRILNKRGIMTSYQMKIAEKQSAAAETEKSFKDTGLDSLDPFWKFK